MKRTVIGAVVAGIVSVMAMGATEFLGSIYRSDTVACTNAETAFSFAYTNDTGSKVAIASIMARSDYATNNWSILIVNSDQTNILVAPTALNYVTYSIKYDGTGNIPLGNGGKIILNGAVWTNAAGLVSWQIHTK